MATKKRSRLSTAKEQLQEARDLLLAVGGRADREIQELRREVSSLKGQLATVTAQRDELLRAAVRVLNTSPKTCGSDTRQLDHFDACTDLGIVVERFAAVEQASDSGPVGINGQRDPDFPCDMFRNGKPSENNTCEGDGHYLCNECGHYRCDPPEESK